MEIIHDGDKVLLKRAKRVDKIDDSIRNIAASMVSIMLENNGIGLSGNQVNILKRIIVVLVGNKPEVMINPEIIFRSESNLLESEGCLSFPGQFYDISRPKEIKVKYRNLSGHPVVKTYFGLTARIVSHEIDHLDGITFVKRMSN